MTGARDAAANAQAALLLEVAGTPKPGNVDRERDLSDLHFEEFLLGTVGAGPGLRAARDGDSVGEAFELAVGGMADRAGTNTQFGALLLLVPLVRAAVAGEEDPLDAVDDVVAGTTVEDAAAFYRAADQIDVFVRDPPAGAGPLDLRRGADAVPAVRQRGLTLREVLSLGDDADDVAAEWTGGFRRTAAAAAAVADADGPLVDRAADTFLRLLAAEPDSLVAGQHGDDVAREVTDRAADLLDADRAAVAGFADDLVERDVNPGTTADLTAAGLFVALERGVEP